MKLKLVLFSVHKAGVLPKNSMYKPMLYPSNRAFEAHISPGLIDGRIRYENQSFNNKERFSQ